MLRKALCLVAVLTDDDHVKGGRIALTSLFDGWGTFCELGKNRLGEHANRMNGGFVCFLTWSWAECVAYLFLL